MRSQVLALIVWSVSSYLCSPACYAQSEYHPGVSTSLDENGRETDSTAPSANYDVASSICVMPADPSSDYSTVSMLNGTSQLKLFGTFSALTIFSSDRPYAPGLPLFLLPGSPFGLDTNTFDIHARQSNFGGSFVGPKAGGFTPSATFLAFIANDSLTGDSYGFLPYTAFGELSNESWRVAAGLQNDVFNPRKPAVISLASLFTSGNTGSFRSQARLERSFGDATSNSLLFQFALSDPIQSVLTSRNTRIQEDNGWPNIEGRINLGIGPIEPLSGGRKARAFEIGTSAFLGQLRTTRSILAPPDPQSPVREIADCWGVGIDTSLNFTQSLGVQAEFFTGAGLGEYNGAIGQTYDSGTGHSIRAAGGWGEGFLYLTPKFHFHAGYAIDAPFNAPGDTFLLTENRTGYINLVWNYSKNVQISNQVDLRKTSYRSPLLDAEGMIFYSEFQWKF